MNCKFKFHLRASIHQGAAGPVGSFFWIFRSTVRSNYFALTNIHEGKKQQTSDMADNHPPHQRSLLSFFHYYLHAVSFLSSSFKSSSESFRTNKSSTGISKIHARITALSMDGRLSPRSHLETDLSETPSFCASCAYVRSCAFLFTAIYAPILL